MNTFKVIAKRVDEYDIQVDPEYWNEERLADWSSVFHEIETPEELAETVAACLLTQGKGEFYEGFGFIKTMVYSKKQKIMLKCMLPVMKINARGFS